MLGLSKRVVGWVVSYHFSPSPKDLLPSIVVLPLISCKNMEIKDCWLGIPTQSSGNLTLLMQTVYFAFTVNLKWRLPWKIPTLFSVNWPVQMPEEILKCFKMWMRESINCFWECLCLPVLVSYPCGRKQSQQICCKIWLTTCLKQYQFSLIVISEFVEK